MVELSCLWCAGESATTTSSVRAGMMAVGIREVEVEGEESEEEEEGLYCSWCRREEAMGVKCEGDCQKSGRGGDPGG